MRNFDYPVPMHGRMMRQRLWETGLDARMLYDTLRDTDAVPAWTTDKIAVAAHNVGQVSRYLRFKASEPQSFGSAAPTTGKGTGSFMAVLPLAALVLGSVILLPALADRMVKAPRRRRRR